VSLTRCGEPGVQPRILNVFAAFFFSGVTRELDPRVHLLRKFFRSGWIAGSNPAMTTALILE
jgi:hypothetical protein